MTDRLKPRKVIHNITSFGTNIGTNIKDHIVHNKEYSMDDELISHYEHDVKVARKALKYVSHQTSKLATSYWPHFFNSTIKSTQLFIDLIGGNSLQFKGIEEYYHEFDKIQAELEIPMVHPKERQFTIDSINHELYNFLTSMEQLKIKISGEWDIRAQSTKLRVVEMNQFLDNILKLAKKRNKKQKEFHKIESKIDKLIKKSGVLSDKESSELNSFEQKLKDVRSIYSKLDEKLKSILPHSMSLLDEFVEKMTKSLICYLEETYNEINNYLIYYSKFHGYFNPDSDDGIYSYNRIIEQWESNFTASKIQIESSISFIVERDSDKLEKDIDDEEHSSRTNKLWKMANKKLTKNGHNLKTEDHVNGMFSDYMLADQLDSYEKYANNSYNRSSTYHPSKKVDINDIIPPTTASIAGPPLPPRENTAYKNTFNSSTSNPPKYVPIQQDQFFMNDLNDTPTDEYDSESDSILSDTSASISSTSSNFELGNSSPEALNHNLIKFYNSSKNQIQKAPMTASIEDLTIKLKSVNLFDETSSKTYILDRFQEFFQSLENSHPTNRKKLKAKYTFNGVEVGDLSFKEGDIIEVLLDFQSIDILYNKSHKNWFVGIARSNNDKVRIGFAPSNYF